MSEVHATPAQDASAPVDPAVHAGAQLRRAREAAGLHVAALAVSLKVPVNKLEALEAGRLDLLPDAVFARALASSVCRTLKIDPRAVLDALPHSSAPKLRTDETGINAPFRAQGESAALPIGSQLLRPAPLIVLALVAGALLLMFMPQLHWERDEAKPEAPALVSAPAPVAAAESAAAPLVPAAPVAAVASAPAPVLAAAAPSTSVAAAPAPAATVAPVAAPQITPAAAAASAAASAASASTPTTGIVVFQPRGETWVQVTDANGAVALRKTLKAGETAGASGALPLAVVVGKADLTTVEVRGKAFDLAPVSRDNVARFEVK